jgi:hypothetical protein
MMDVAVPANMKVGLAQEEIARRGWTLSAGQALAVDDLRLLGMQHQLAGRKAVGKRAP